jgi:CTP:molybdopterin cytidylyltransferase MocA
MSGRSKNVAARRRPSPRRPRASTIRPVSGPTVLIMAAGEGTRMHSSLPKVLHPVCGRPMVAWPVLAAREAGAERVAVIVAPERDLTSGLPEGTETVVQPQPDGTGGAIRAAHDVVRDSDTVVVLSGDHPLINAEIVSALLETHRASKAGATVMTVELDDPAAYGRIVRDEGGDIERIVETKDPAEVGSTPRSSRSPRSTPAPTCSRPSRSSKRSTTWTPTTPRASTTWAMSCHSFASTATASLPTSPTIPTSTSASTTAPTWRW